MCVICSVWPLKVQTQRKVNARWMEERESQSQSAALADNPLMSGSVPLTQGWTASKTVGGASQLSSETKCSDISLNLKSHWGTATVKMIITPALKQWTQSVCMYVCVCAIFSMHNNITVYPDWPDVCSAIVRCYPYMTRNKNSRKGHRDDVEYATYFSMSVCLSVNFFHMMRSLAPKLATHIRLLMVLIYITYYGFNMLHNSHSPKD